MLADQLTDCRESQFANTLLEAVQRLPMSLLHGSECVIDVSARLGSVLSGLRVRGRVPLGQSVGISLRLSPDALALVKRLNLFQNLRTNGLLNLGAQLIDWRCFLLLIAPLTIIQTGTQSDSRDTECRGTN
jgi:hypothetical protein